MGVNFLYLKDDRVCGLAGTSSRPTEKVLLEDIKTLGDGDLGKFAPDLSISFIGSKRKGKGNKVVEAIVCDLRDNQLPQKHSAQYKAILTAKEMSLESLKVK